MIIGGLPGVMIARLRVGGVLQMISEPTLTVLGCVTDREVFPGVHK
jgi:hypothetical protein